MIIQKTLIGFLFISLLFSCGRRYRAPSGSMEKTIMTGETFYVTPVDSFQRNDIVVFNYYGNDYAAMPDENGNYKQHWEKRVLRLIAVSGDIIELKKGELYLNDERIPLPPKAVMEYEVRSKSYMTGLDSIQNSDNILVGYNGTRKAGDTFIYTVPLSVEEALRYNETPGIISISMIPAQPSNLSQLIRPFAFCQWTVDDFGPLKIPLPGTTIVVDSFNFQLYHNIPGIIRGKNMINEKLYFVIGDNRHGAEDSRYIGFIAHSKMYGIVK
jgi:signal peptidase I